MHESSRIQKVKANSFPVNIAHDISPSSKNIQNFIKINKEKKHHQYQREHNQIFFFLSYLIPVEAHMAAADGAGGDICAARHEFLAAIHRIQRVEIMNLVAFCVRNLSHVLHRYGFDHLPVVILVAAADRTNKHALELLATVRFPI